VRNSEEKPQSYEQYLKSVKNKDINQVLVGNLLTSQEHSRFNITLNNQMEAWLKVFFENRF
jgi:hypothetical protein